MPSRDELHEKVMGVVNALPFGERQEGLMELITLAMGFMDMATVADFRHELSMRLSEEILTLVDGHIALRELYGPEDGSAPRKA